MKLTNAVKKDATGSARKKREWHERNKGMAENKSSIEKCKPYRKCIFQHLPSFSITLNIRSRFPGSSL